MKHMIIAVLTLTLISHAYADSSIDQDIARILKAPQAERVEMMNQLKTKLAAMNAQERSEAIRNLQMGMNGSLQGTQMGQNIPMQNIHSNIQQQSSMGTMNHQHSNSRR